MDRFEAWRNPTGPTPATYHISGLARHGGARQDVVLGSVEVRHIPMRKKTLFAGIAALLLATGAAHATETFHAQCGHKLIYVFGRNGWSFTTQEEGELPERQFRLGFDKKGMRTLYFRGRKCHHYVDEISGQEYR